MGCGASTNVQARLDYITLLEAEVQDLKAQRGEALQVRTCTCHETQGGAVTPCRPQFPPCTGPRGDRGDRPTRGPWTDATAGCSASP